jgi:Fe2+ or Zn2+ uptake regulation protein
MERTMVKASPDKGEALRRGGHRLTPQRQMVLRTLDQAGHHLSAEEICQRIQVEYPGMSLSTVYRTLDLLARLGLVLESQLGGDRRVFELAGDTGEHTHLICRQCGVIAHPATLDLESLQRQLAAESAYRALTLNVVATGICPACAAGRHAHLEHTSGA